MNQQLEKLLLQTFTAKSVLKEELIQNLWSNYGQILRVSLQNGSVSSVIVKNIATGKTTNHPRGWNTSNSHNRKVKSYEVETNWYNHWASRCNDNCRVATCYAIKQTEEGKVLLLEDLDEVGFNHRKSHLTVEEAKLCLSWLANLHATFLNEEPDGLWSTGTYWHLETRPDELIAMEESPLKHAASEIDAMLNGCNYKTLVHGDAKVANFCFDTTNNKVAAVDFQYVGGGCGMKDVVYFLGSCLTEDECELYETELLNDYFCALKTALKKTNQEYNFFELEKEWRSMYAIAWADFTRFLLGWAPAHQKLNNYCDALVEAALSKVIIQ